MKEAVIKQMKRIGLFFSLLVLSHQSFSQFDLPDPDGGTPPPAVPFDDNLNIILIAAGVLFAIIVLKRIYRPEIAAK